MVLNQTMCFKERCSHWSLLELSSGEKVSMRVGEEDIDPDHSAAKGLKPPSMPLWSQSKFNPI